MHRRHWYRLLAIPVYLALLSGLGMAGIVPQADQPIQAWTTVLSKSWTSVAAVPFVLGNAAVGLYAAERAWRDDLEGAAKVGFVGTFFSFYVSALLLPLPSGEWVTFDPGLRFSLVFTVGWPGLIAGTVLPPGWGRLEARRFGDDEPTLA